MGTSVSDSEEESGSKWCPEDEFDPQVALEVINSRNSLSGAGSDGLRFSHIHHDSGREEIGAGIEAFWRRIVDDPSAFPPKFWPCFK